MRKAFDKKGNEVTLPIRQVFICDCCGITVPFYNGIGTYRAPNLPESEFCSELCLRQIIAQGVVNA